MRPKSSARLAKPLHLHTFHFITKSSPIYYMQAVPLSTFNIFFHYHPPLPSVLLQSLPFPSPNAPIQRQKITKFAKTQIVENECFVI